MYRSPILSRSILIFKTPGTRFAISRETSLRANLSSFCMRKRVEAMFFPSEARVCGDLVELGWRSAVGLKWKNCNERNSSPAAKTWGYSVLVTPCSFVLSIAPGKKIQRHDHLAVSKYQHDLEQDYHQKHPP